MEILWVTKAQPRAEPTDPFDWRKPLFIQLCWVPTSRHHSEFQGANFIPAAGNCKSGACFPEVFTVLCLYSAEFALILIPSDT